MEWLNLHTSVLDSEEVVGAEPVERATWLFLLRYCAGQENGGTIIDCAEWSDRKWQQLCRVTAAEVKGKSKLWTWWQNSLRVWSYPVSHQDHVQRNRAQAKRAADTRWRKQMRNGEAPPKARKKTTHAPKPRCRPPRTDCLTPSGVTEPATEEAGVSF